MTHIRIRLLWTSFIIPKIIIYAQLQESPLIISTNFSDSYPNIRIDCTGGSIFFYSPHHFPAASP